MPEPKSDRPSWLRYSGIGIEYAAAVAGFALLGYWIDRRYDTKPWALLVCVGFGLIGATYNLIRESMRAFSTDEKSKNGEPKTPRGQDGC